MTATIAPEVPAVADDAQAAPGQAAAFDRTRRRRRQRTALAIVAYVALALLAFYPYGPFDTSHLPGAIKHSPAGADPLQMTWFLTWFPYAVTHGLNIFQTSRFEYPYGVNLADNTTVPFLGFIAWPVTATLGPIAAFNFLVRLCFALDGIAMFLVLRRWTRSLSAAFVGGLLYAFGPYSAAQVLHIDLVFVPIPPLLVLCFDELLSRQKMRPWKLGLLIGALFAAELYVSPDVLAGCGVIMGSAIVGLCLRFRHKVREKLPYVLKTVATGLGLFLLATGFMIWEMVAGPRHLDGPVISANVFQTFRANLLGPILPTSNQLGVPHFISDVSDVFVAHNLSENGTYIGIPLLIVLFVIVKRLWSDEHVRTFFWLGVVALVASLGSQLSILGWNTHLPLPEAVFQDVPLLDNTIPARYSLYVVMFAAIVLAIGLDRLWLARRLGLPARAEPSAEADLLIDGIDTYAGLPPEHGPRLSERWLRRLGPLGADTTRARSIRVGIVVAAVGFSLLPSAPFLQRRTPWPGALEPAIRHLIKPGTVVLTYPYATPLHPAGMVWQAEDQLNFTLLGGYANLEHDGVDTRWPVSLIPGYPQQLLAYSSLGDKFPYPLPPTTADYTDLRTFLTKYHIGAVVYWAGGDDRVASYNYIRLSLGPPTLRRHLCAIWLPVDGRWYAPGQRPHKK